MYVLLFIFLSAAGTVSTGTAEFNDKAACEAAVDAIADNWGKSRSASAFCTPKGTEPQDDVQTSPPVSRAPSGGTTAKAPVARK